MPQQFETGYTSYRAVDNSHGRERTWRVTISPGSGLREGLLSTKYQDGSTDFRYLTEREIDAVILGATEAITS